MVVKHLLPYSNKKDPIMALYGYLPPSITSYLRENSKVQAVEFMLLLY